MRRILIIEDNKRLYESYLRRHISDRFAELQVKHEIFHAPTIQKGLELLLSERYDQCLVDYNLGHPYRCETADGPLVITNGAELVATIRAQEAKNPEMTPAHFIAMASHPMGQMAILQAGANGEIQKDKPYLW